MVLDSTTHQRRGTLMKTLVLALIFSCFSINEPAPTVITCETDEEMLTAAENKMTDWEDILKWFISWNDAKLKENENIYKSLNDWDTQVAKCDELKKHITLTTQLFLKFRNQCADTLALSFDGKAEKNEMHALAQFSLTTWYLDYLETYLLPENWKELYQTSKLPPSSSPPL